MTTQATAPSPPPDLRGLSAVERALRVVTDVRPGEGGTALLLTLNVFIVLCAYYLIKPVREALIGAVPNGPEYKSYMGAGIAATLFVAVPAYARFAKSLPRNKLIMRVSLFFAANLVAFYALGQTPWVKEGLGATLYGLGFLLWVGVFNMMVVAQFWAFAADVYTEEQGNRLFSLVAVGAALGAVAGSEVVNRLVKLFGTLTMMLLSAGMLVVAGLITQVIHARATKGEGTRAKDGDAAKEPAGEPKKPEDTSGAYALVLKNRYLLLIAVFTLLFTLVNTSGEFMISQLVRDASASHAATSELRRDFIAEYFSDYFRWVNLIGMLLQLFVVSRIVKYGGFKWGFMVYPVIALLTSGAVAASPVLLTVRVGKTAENAVDYSLNNTVRNMLWLPTTRRMKYLAKQVVDSLFSRLGDVGAAAGVFILYTTLHLGIRGMAIMNLVLVCAWIYVAWAIIVEREKVSAAHNADLERELDAG